MEYKKRLKKILLIVLPVFIIGLLYALFIELTGMGLDCVIYENFGVKCPGCGVTRMCMHILHFDFISAFFSNQLLFIALPIAAVWIMVKMIVYVRTGDSLYTKIEKICTGIFLVSTVIFCIVRNIK